jgi:hypothetical protein
MGKEKAQRLKKKHSELISRIQKGKQNPNWKGGKYIDSHNYVMIKKPSHPFADKRGYVQEHRLVMEKHLGRYLKPEEIVHHLDWDRTNNHIDNLHLFSSKGEHLNYHKMLKKIVKDFISSLI